MKLPKRDNITLSDYALALAFNTPDSVKYRIIHGIFPGHYSTKHREMLGKIEKEGQLMSVNFNNRKIVFNRVDDAIEDTTAALINEIFVGQAYGALAVGGKRVLDIGGCIGDTAIYFLAKGASGVVSYDPDARLCEIARKNLEANGMANAEVVSEPASSKTIDAFAERFAGQPKALKIDCEGAEYEMILNATRLNEYDSIALEYHHGYLNIAKKLEDLGFVVSHTRPRLFLSGFTSGYVFARKKQ